MDYNDMSNSFTFKWCSTVDEIASEDWVKIYGSDIIKSREFMKANEIAEFEDVEFHYLQVFKDMNIIAIVPCFSYGMDIMNIASSGKAKTWISWIRRIIPSFLKLRAFVTGSYAATCEHFIEYVPELSEMEKKEVAKIIGEEIKRLSIEVKSCFVFVKDVRERSLQYVKDILTKDYRFFISFPTTAIPILPNVTYPNGLRKKNRKRYRKFRDCFENSFHWDIINDYGGEPTKQFTHLYKAVLEKAKNKFEFLNERFFEATNDLLGEKSFFLVAKDNFTDEIRVMVIVLENDANLIPLYMGFNYKNDDSKVLYLNTIFRVVKEAEARGKSYVDFGQMSYYPKTMSGALTENIYYGFWSGKPVVRWFINHWLDKIFTPPAIPEHVYLEDYADEAHSVLTERGFVLLN